STCSWWCSSSPCWSASWTAGTRGSDPPPRVPGHAPGALLSLGGCPGGGRGSTPPGAAPTCRGRPASERLSNSRPGQPRCATPRRGQRCAARAGVTLPATRWFSPRAPVAAAAGSVLALDSLAQGGDVGPEPAPLLAFL